MTSFLYTAVVKEISSDVFGGGDVERWWSANFSDLMHKCDRPDLRILYLDRIDFAKGKVFEYEDPEAALDAWKQGDEYEATEAGLYDQRTLEVAA